MAIKRVTRITDDIDGHSEAETVKFGLWGATYEVDLSAENQKALESALEPYLAVARKPTSAAPRRGPGRTGSAPAGAGGYDAAAVRSWAAANGIEVSPRGRIPGGVLDKYQAAAG